MRGAAHTVLQVPWLGVIRVLQLAGEQQGLCRQGWGDTTVRTGRIGTGGSAKAALLGPAFSPTGAFLALYYSALHQALVCT